MNEILQQFEKTPALEVIFPDVLMFMNNHNVMFFRIRVIDSNIAAAKADDKATKAHIDCAKEYSAQLQLRCETPCNQFYCNNF